MFILGVLAFMNIVVGSAIIVFAISDPVKIMATNGVAAIVCALLAIASAIEEKRTPPTPQGR